MREQRYEPLNAARTIDYLIARRFLRADEVVHADLRIADVSRRNYNLAISAAHRGYFVKQAVDADTASSIAREAEIYSRTASTANCQMLRALQPLYLDYDASRHLLIVGLVEDATDLESSPHRFSRAGAKRVAGALATIHAVDPAIGSGSHPAPPWPFALALPPLSMAQEMTPAARQLVGLAQQNSSFAQHLRDAASQWSGVGLIHGDLRLANVVVGGAPRRIDEASEVRLVDWENCGVGDPSWDVAGYFAAYISAWALSARARHSRSAPRGVRPKYAITRIHAPISAFWQQYASLLELSAGESSDRLSRSVVFAGVRILQYAIERALHEGELTFATVRLLQLAENVLARPYDAVVALLGLRLGSLIGEPCIVAAT
jgi:thiamine kinase-like enzyme